MIVSTFIVLASFMIITYDRQNMFIIQATGYSKLFAITFKFMMPYCKGVHDFLSEPFVVKALLPK